MDLNVREAARRLRVAGKTIYPWGQQGKLPAYRVNEQYRFNRAELLEWATSQRYRSPVVHPSRIQTAFRYSVSGQLEATG